MFTSAKVTTNNYVSYMVTPYNAWFRSWGYPRLDLNIYDDGEWEIIEYLRSPVVPALTPWHRVLMDIRNTEINPWFCKKYVENLDVEKQHVWDELDRNEERHRQALYAEELHATDFAERAFKAIKQNPELMERIAKNGLGEIDLFKLSKHIPNQRFRKAPKKTTGGIVLS